MTRSTTSRPPRKGSPRSTTPDAAPPPGTNGGSPVTTEDIARRAYELYEARGRTDGAQVDDWLLAEQQLGELYGGAGAQHAGPLNEAKRKRAPKPGAAAR
jgi:DUF2934 family protein